MQVQWRARCWRRFGLAYFFNFLDGATAKPGGGTLYTDNAFHPAMLDVSGRSENHQAVSNLCILSRPYPEYRFL